MILCTRLTSHRTQHTPGNMLHRGCFYSVLGPLPTPPITFSSLITTKPQCQPGRTEMTILFAVDMVWIQNHADADSKVQVRVKSVTDGAADDLRSASKETRVINFPSYQTSSNRDKCFV